MADGVNYHNYRHAWKSSHYKLMPGVDGFEGFLYAFKQIPSESEVYTNEEILEYSQNYLIRAI